MIKRLFALSVIRRALLVSVVSSVCGIVLIAYFNGYLPIKTMLGVKSSMLAQDLSKSLARAEDVLQFFANKKEHINIDSPLLSTFAARSHDIREMILFDDHGEVLARSSSPIFDKIISDRPVIVADAFSKARINSKHSMLIGPGQDSESIALLCQSLKNTIDVNIGFICAVLARPQAWNAKESYFKEYFGIGYDVSLSGPGSFKEPVLPFALQMHGMVPVKEWNLFVTVPFGVLIKKLMLGFMDVFLMLFGSIFLGSVIFFRIIEDRKHGAKK